MNASSDTCSLHDLARLMSGALEGSGRERLRRQLDEPTSDLRVLLDGLAELPTSLLSTTLEHIAAHEAAPQPADEDDDFVDDENVQRGIKEVVHDQIVRGIPVQGLANRAIVDEVYQRLVGSRKVTAATRRKFYEAAGSALADVIALMAREPARFALPVDDGGEPPVAGDTVAGTHTTIVDSLRHPERVVARDARLEQLRAADAELARVYLLSTFAGRTIDEVAELLQLPLANVEEAVAIARVEVCLDDP